MARITEIKSKSNQYLAEFEANILRVIHSNEKSILDANRSQMLRSKDADDKPLIHKRTGSARLSSAYARRTGKRTPNLFLSGEFQSEMSFLMEDSKQYYIGSFSPITPYLAGNYGKIFGVSPINQPKIQSKNESDIVKDYLKKIFG